MVVLNHEIGSLINRARQYRIEFNKSSSSNLSAVSEADFGRFKSYIKSIRDLLNYYAGKKPLDLPESSPFQIDLGAREELPKATNHCINDMVLKLDLFENEIGNSQSSRQASGLIAPDIERATAILDDMDGYLTEYVSSILPLDLPESAPSTPLTGVGRTGI